MVSMYFCPGCSVWTDTTHEGKVLWRRIDAKLLFID